MTTGAHPHPALHGLKVIDFSQGGAGPYCTQLLADFGADVIKIEPPRGDWAREMGVIDQHAGMSGTFMSLNRNKLGLCMDLTQTQAIDIARRLCAEADIVVEAFRPGVMQRLGLSAQQLRQGRESLIYCSISGYGQTGPNVALPASDSVMQAYGGFMSLVGDEGGEPLRVANIVSDMLTGTNAFACVLLALHRRHETGLGGWVGTSLLDSIVGFQAPILSEYLLTGNPPVRRGNKHPLIAASGVFKTRDGRVAFTVLDHYWQPFCDIMNIVQVPADPRFATPQSRMIHRADVAQAMQDAVAHRTVREVLDILGPAGVLCAPVQDYAALLTDPQVCHNELLSEIVTGQGVSLPMVRSPMSLDGPSRQWSAPPRVGEHTEYILRQRLGLNEGQIAGLIQQKTIIAASPTR
jgi:crotonobetainyl-CoA:carnitine CoA-transferase CaiB-like acyl-CoA transferase